MEEQRFNFHGQPSSQSIASEGDKKNFSERSDIAQEIIRQKSGILEKWSLVIFMSLILSLAAAAIFLQFADTIHVKGLVKLSTTASEILPGQSGKIAEMLVKNNQSVKQGEVLGWLECGANMKDIIEFSVRLDSCVQSILTGDNRKLMVLLKNSYINLGELDNAYKSFLISCKLYVHDYENEAGVRLNKSFVQINGRWSRNSDLRTGKIILHKQMAVALLLLKVKVEKYIKDNSIQSPASGTVNFFPWVANKRFVEMNKSMGYIIKSNTKYYLDIKLDNRDVHKLADGMKVQLQLDSYLYPKSGMIPGTLAYICSGDTGSTSSCIIQLDNGLLTDQNKVITYHNGLTATLIIVTKKTLWSEMFYGHLKGLFK